MPSTARSNIQLGSANRSPSRSAIGRAPIAMMSRRIPPTPVAAPWNGSTADGWLWLSTLKATACPSPRSSTPAFSPGPCSTRAPRDGSRFSTRAECLYPQCSDQSREKTASSKWFGSRSSSPQIRSNSPSVRPRARWSGCSTTRVRCLSLDASADGPEEVGGRWRAAPGTTCLRFLRRVLQLVAAGLHVALDLLAAAGGGEALVADGLAGLLFHLAGGSVGLVAHRGTPFVDCGCPRLVPERPRVTRALQRVGQRPSATRERWIP